MMHQISTLSRPEPASTLPGEWRQFARFLRRPRVPARARRPDRRSVAATGRLLLLDFALMAALLVIGGTAYLAGAEFPDNALQDLAWTAPVLLLIIVGAPVMEETLFRGWLSGRPGHALALLTLGAGAAALSFVAAGGGASPNIAALAIGAGTAAMAAAALWTLRQHDRPAWYARAFPLFFWASALAFASIHIWNYTGPQNWVVFVLVIPQLIAGTIFGYARVHYGLWSAIALHMLHNGTAVTLALLTEQVTGAG
ncbi:CPBP family intramembrane metalloprotease [Erythrobacteraceae bacterium CFH 75059]|uniref:CPBP family glutamic-type intramembrane protease n=1 Tax=Qipengyuania thermophila TaxID=2509361 RepID=UPI0010200FD1|nr:CPBP family glutamic-type intramembrane protease [Qipengyuania thermophila]TCD04783.1 CPBP family intramembrane metalloprotease [Erythrobacteraceae bacterium CFH 75059]